MRGERMIPKGPLGMFGIAQSQLERIGYNPLEASNPMGEPMSGGGGGGGFGFSLGGPQRINQGFAEKDYVGFDDHYTGAGRRGAGSYGFGGSNHNVEAYRKLNPVAQKAFTDDYMKDNRYSNVTIGSKWAKPVESIPPLANRVVVGGRGRGGRGGVTRSITAPKSRVVVSGRGRGGRGGVTRRTGGR